jgi:hypothetical protein
MSPQKAAFNETFTEFDIIQPAGCLSGTQNATNGLYSDTTGHGDVSDHDGGRSDGRLQFPVDHPGQIVLPSLEHIGNPFKGPPEKPLSRTTRYEGLFTFGSVVLERLQKNRTKAKKEKESSARFFRV